MALTKEQKQAQVTELVTKLKEAESVMFSHYIGLSVADVSELRKKLREQNAEMKVAKKTLMQLAFKEAGLPEIEAKGIDGAVACIFSFADAVSGAQVAYKFGKDHDQVELVGGVFDGKLLSKEEAAAIAKMPSREQLLGTFVGMLRSPLVSFASMCSSPLGGFARALDQLAEKGGAGEQEAAAEPEAPAAEAEVAETPAEAEAESADATEEAPEAVEQAPAEEASADAEQEAAPEAEESDTPKEE